MRTNMIEDNEIVQAEYENERDEYENKKSKKKKKRKFPKITICFIAIAVIMVALASIISNLTKDTEPTITTKGIKQEIAVASELITGKLSYTGLIKYSDGKIPYLTEEAFSMIYDAEVIAGIDVERVDIDILENKVILTLPKAKVKSINIESVEYYDQKFALFKNDAKEDAEKAKEVAKKDVKKNADIEGLLETANKQMENIIYTLLKDEIGDKELVIKWK